MLLTMQKMVRIYKLRWTIEETFKILKHCVGINRCQQHSVALQEIFIWMCFLTVNFQNVCLDDSILSEVLAIY